MSNAKNLAVNHSHSIAGRSCVTPHSTFHLEFMNILILMEYIYLEKLIVGRDHKVFGVEPGPGICRGPEEEKDEIRSAAAIYFPHPTSADKKELALVVLCLTETLHDNSTSYGKRGFR
ncbi:hypothetical protein BHM03_00031898 [Ensete ventricosum]|nr:hypothetical protein BHM03_00031898 [Ensete ventricosum]